MTLNPDGGYAQLGAFSLPKPTFFHGVEYDAGWGLEAEWFLGTTTDPVKISLMVHPTEGVQVLRITGRPESGVSMEESCDWRDLRDWLTEQAVPGRR